MRFSLSQEQRSFADAIDGLLTTSDVPRITRDWAAGDHDAGLALWRRLAELGLTALQVPEELGGIGGTPLDAAVAFERLGFHAVPGPWIETVVLAPALLAGTDAQEQLAAVAEGELLVTVAAPPSTPRALDADIAGLALVLDDTTLHTATAGTPYTSVDPARRLYDLAAGDVVAGLSAEQAAAALDGATLACAATLLGAGERMLRDTVSYVGARKQFGRPVGEYQALKHALADVRVALDFARPLVHGAALELGAATPVASRDVSAALVACADAAYLSSRTALQLHGAIGYTLEFDLSLWLLKVRAMVTAWGTPAHHRGRVLDALVASAGRD